MVQYITNPTFRGNKKIANPKTGSAIYADDLDFALPEQYVFDFTLLQQAEEIGLIRTLYLDNSVNPKLAEILVSQTGQYIVCPPFSVGYFPVATQPNSTITISSVGGVTGGEKCYAAFFTDAIPPAVWNGFAPLIDGARVTLIGVDGVTNMSATNPLIVGGNNGGAPVPIKVDATGRVEVVGAAAGGVVYGPDAQGASPTQSPVLIAGVDSSNFIRRILTSSAGLIRIQLDAISASLTGASSQQIQGAGASGALAVGNPVGVGGVYNVTNPTLTDGQRGDFQITARGYLGTTLYAENGTALSTGSVGDGNSSGTAITARSLNQIYNGTSYDRVRSITSITDIRAGLGVISSGAIGQYLVSPYTLTDGQYGQLQLTADGRLKISADTSQTQPVSIAGTVSVNPTKPTTGTITSPANATSSFVVLAANANRRGATITCEGSSVKIALAASASATAYTIELNIGDYYEVPFDYTGIITGISASVTGNLRVTELV